MMMANNRLYIEGTETGNRLFVAKSYGGGWGWETAPDKINEWLAQRSRDWSASFGDKTPSKLQFRTENEPAFDAK
jgi:hypothetical protein